MGYSQFCNKIFKYIVVIHELKPVFGLSEMCIYINPVLSTKVTILSNNSKSDNRHAIYMSVRSTTIG